MALWRTEVFKFLLVVTRALRLLDMKRGSFVETAFSIWRTWSRISESGNQKYLIVHWAYYNENESNDIDYIKLKVWRQKKVL